MRRQLYYRHESVNLAAIIKRYNYCRIYIAHRSARRLIITTIMRSFVGARAEISSAILTLVIMMAAIMVTWWSTEDVRLMLMVSTRRIWPHKTFLKHLYNVCPTSKTLGWRCTNVIKMFCVCWPYPHKHETLTRAETATGQHFVLGRPYI